MGFFFFFFVHTTTEPEEKMVNTGSSRVRTRSLEMGQNTDFTRKWTPIKCNRNISVYLRTGFNKKYLMSPQTTTADTQEANQR